MITITKSELRKKFEHREQLALHKVSKPKSSSIKEYKYAGLAKSFLQNYDMFKNYMNIFDENQSFTVMSSCTSYKYKCKESTIILFDSFTITLLQVDNNFFIYIIAEYMLK